MAKIGRNDPCPCGSGKKYKKCCLSQDEELERQAVAAEGVHDHRGFCEDCYGDLADASDAVLDLVEADKLDEAEIAALDLVERFPDAFDGYARLGLIYETRGDAPKAIEYYQKVVDFADDYPALSPRWLKRDFRALIAHLETTLTTR
jgi:tetratricopeptide (TPR) repeat protein